MTHLDVIPGSEAPRQPTKSFEDIFLAKNDLELVIYRNLKVYS